LQKGVRALKKGEVLSLAEFMESIEKKVQILVSPFSGDNKQHLAIRDSAMEITGDKVEEYEWERIKVCHPIYSPGMKFLVDKLNSFPPIPPSQELAVRIWGMFDKQVEPSIACELMADMDQFSIIKHKVIAFGQHFDQQNVHFSYSLGKDPGLIDTASLAEDVTCQFAWLVNFVSIQNIFAFAEIAKDYGVKDLSLTAMGMQLLLYTMPPASQPPV
jgi:hypothetical protein